MLSFILKVLMVLEALHCPREIQEVTKVYFQVNNKDQEPQNNGGLFLNPLKVNDNVRSRNRQRACSVK